MPRTGATRRNSDGPLQALIGRVQGIGATPTAATGAPDGRLTDQAIVSLGLHNQPFRPPGGQIPYFFNAQLESLLDELETCVGNAESLVILEGEEESGKTCTIAQLMERFYDGGHVFLVRAGQGVGAESILRSMLSAYRSTTPQTLAECTQQLADHLADHGDLGAASVLTVEDVDRMQGSELQLLLQEIDTINSQLDEPLSVLFSSAEPAESILEGIHSVHTANGQVDAFTMPRLDADETASYIATRLAAAGYEDALPLDERELQVVSHSSNGLPGYVDRAAAHALNAKFNRQQLHALMAPSQWWRATRRHLRWVMAGLAMLILGLALGAWNAQPKNTSDTLVKSLPIPTSPGAGAVPEAPSSTVVGQSESEALELKSAQTRVEPVPETAAPASVSTDTTSATNQALETAASEASETPAAAASVAADTTDSAIAQGNTNSTSTIAAVDTAEVNTDPVKSVTENTVVSATASAESDDVATSATVQSTESTATQVADATEESQSVAVATESEAPASTSTQVATASTDTATPETAAATRQPDNSVLGGVISGAKWIERRDPDRFTVQLLAGADEAGLRLHARKHDMASLSAIYRTLRNGQPWFALVHGDFESSAEAREAVASMPEIWQQNSPWIRKFDDVQKAIN